MILGLILLLGCGRDGDTGVDCREPPTYDSWVRGFLEGKCQSCHASTAPNRHGAPPNVTFGSEVSATEWSERIYITIFEEGSMPPSGGVTQDERILLEQWLDCPTKD